jgi:ABC-type branched-subunit amino acid transport system ATPase component
LSTADVPVLTVDQVNVRFGGVHAVRDATLHAYAGEVTGLIGPNGAGKTTTFNVITGLDVAESEALGDLLLDLAAEGKAVLLVEHDVELVMRVCSRITVLDFGQVIAAGTPREIQQNPHVQAAYLGQEDPELEEVG